MCIRDSGGDVVGDKVGGFSGSIDGSERRAKSHSDAGRFPTMVRMKPSGTSLRRPAVVVVYVSLVGQRDSRDDGGEESERSQ